MWVTALVCYHPARRTYTVADATCQVCLGCLAVRSTAEGFWPPEKRRLCADGRMLNWAGREIHDDWRELRRRRDDRPRP